MDVLLFLQLLLSSCLGIAFLFNWKQVLHLMVLFRVRFCIDGSNISLILLVQTSSHQWLLSLLVLDTQSLIQWAIFIWHWAYHRLHQQSLRLDFMTWHIHCVLIWPTNWNKMRCVSVTSVQWSILVIRSVCGIGFRLLAQRPWKWPVQYSSTWCLRPCQDVG